ncbi:MAG: DUF47 family protein [Methanospirillaceae archaeon]|nr:DUF47 family protein [Methanospirillaceae archaeon]
MSQDPRKISQIKQAFYHIFPVRYDFEGMLEQQAAMTLQGITTFYTWMQEVPLQEPAGIEQQAALVDQMRYDLEEKLMDAFQTPFDRQDLYALSRQMDYILNFSKETAREMYVFGVQPDKATLAMAKALLCGTRHLAQGVRVFPLKTNEVKEIIPQARNYLHQIEDIYIQSMAALFSTDDPMDAMRKREIYHHLRDAGRALRKTLYLLHKAAVGLE